MNPLKDIDQLPLSIESSRLWGPRDLYRHQVMYQAENGSHWPLFTIDDTDSTISDTRLGQLLGRMVAAYNAQLSAPHNTDECDPDGHIVFVSVCCGAKLYRCGGPGAVGGVGLPSKPIIHHGETACTTCGAALAQF